VSRERAEGLINCRELPFPLTREGAASRTTTGAVPEASVATPNQAICHSDICELMPAAIVPAVILAVMTLLMKDMSAFTWRRAANTR
jgi:hypothetical protein